MLQIRDCNVLCSGFRHLMQRMSWGACYICNVLMINRGNMKGKFDFAGFYESIQKEALRYASGYVFDEEDVRDIVSDSWLRLLEMGETLDSERKVNCLLFAIIKSKCVDYLRRCMCRQKAEKRIKQTADRISDDELSALYQKELFRIVGQTLSGMSALRRTTFKGIRLDGKSYQEVALATHTTRRVVEYQLRKAEEAVSDKLRRLYG